MTSHITPFKATQGIIGTDMDWQYVHLYWPSTSNGQTGRRRNGQIC